MAEAGVAFNAASRQGSKSEGVTGSSGQEESKVVASWPKMEER